MDYEQLINTLSEIVNNDVIVKTGLKLVYELDADNHKKLNEHIFFLRDTPGEFVAEDVFEVECDGIVIELIKKK